MRRSALLPAAAAALALAAPGCGRREPPRPAEESAAPALARTPMPTLSEDERELLAAILEAHDALARAMRAPGSFSDDPEEVIRSMRSFTDPLLARIAPLAPKARALSEERRSAVRVSFLARREDAVRPFLKAMAPWSRLYQEADKTPRFFPVFRAIFGPWRERDAMWVFEVWGEDLARELSEWTMTPDEQLAWRLAEFRRRAGHPVVVRGAERRTVGLQDDCLSCHLGETPWRAAQDRD